MVVIYTVLYIQVVDTSNGDELPNEKENEKENENENEIARGEEERERDGFVGGNYAQLRTENEKLKGQ